MSKPKEIRLYKVKGRGIVATDENNFFIDKNNGFINNRADPYGFIGSATKFMLVDFDNRIKEDLGSYVAEVGTYTDRVFQPGDTVQIKFRPEYGKLADFHAKVIGVKVISPKEYDSFIKMQEQDVIRCEYEKTKKRSEYFDSFVEIEKDLDNVRKTYEDSRNRIIEKKQKLQKEMESQLSKINKPLTLDEILSKELE